MLLHYPFYVLEHHDGVNSARKIECFDDRFAFRGDDAYGYGR
jgi:hypothetical protein